MAYDPKNDSLKDREEQAAGFNGSLPMLGNDEKAFRERFKDALPNLDPTSNPVTGQKPTGNLGENPMNFSRGEGMGGSFRDRLQSLSAGGGAAGLARRAFASIGRNKGKSAVVGAGGVGGLIALYLGGSIFVQTQLIHMTQNSDSTLGGPAQTVIDGQVGELTENMNNATMNRLLKNFRYQANMTILSEKLKTQGYSYDPSTKKLSTPDGGELSGRDMKRELKSLGKGEVPPGSFGRNKQVRGLKKALAIPARAPTEPKIMTDADGNETHAKPEPGDSIKNARKDIKDAEPSSKQVTKAQAEVKDSLGDIDEDDVDKAEKEADDLAEDGTKQADPDTARDTGKAVSPDDLEDVGVEGAERKGGSAASKASAAVDISERVCRIGKATLAAFVAGLIIKKYHLIQHFGAIKRVAEGKMTGRDRAELTNEFMKNTQTNSATGSSFGQGAGMAFLLGAATTRAPTANRMSYFGSHRKDPGGLLSIISKVVKFKIPGLGTPACDILLNPKTQWGIAIAEVASMVIGCIFSACTASAGWQAAAKSMAWAMAKGLAVGIAADLATSYAESYLASYALGLVNRTVTTFSKSEAGDFTGDGFSAGAGGWNENKGRLAGSQPIPLQSYIPIKKVMREEKREQYAKMSLSERFFSLAPEDYNSLASTALARAPINFASPTAFTRSSVSYVANFGFAQEIQKFAEITTSGTAFADDGQTPVDERGLVTDVWGNYIVANNFEDMDAVDTLSSLEASGDIDASGEPKSGSDLQKYIDECTDIDIRVAEISNKLNSRCLSYDQNAYKDGASPKYASQSIGGNNKTKKIQHYLALTYAAGGVDAYYNPTKEGSENTSGDGGSTPAPIDADGLPTAPIPESQTGVTRNGGGIRMFKGIIPQVEAMIDAAANDPKNPVTLTGSGWRDTKQQEKLRADHGCGGANVYNANCKASPPTAVPGRSRHEFGIAIDFSNCSSRSTACYKWLAANAARFGFKNLPSEPWHWSPGGN